MKTTKLSIAIALILSGAMASGAAFAAKPSGAGSGAGGGGGKPGGEETATNNLSRPTIVFSGGGLTNVTCGAAGAWSALVPPTGDPSNGWPIDPTAYYYVQGVNKWQAPCVTWPQADELVPVTGAWGDNLTGDAKLKVGSPIRVELVLSYDPDETVEVDGYVVDKLQPALLDRESKYGTKATDNSDGTFSVTPSPFVPGVYDHTATLHIEQVGGTWVYDQPTTAEINAKGIVVYGYNLRVPTAGAYLITYTVPNVAFNGADAGDCAGQTCSLQITVGGGGGGGGGKGGGGGRP